MNQKYTRDFKDTDVFTNIVVDKLLIVVHEEGVALGWREWTLYTHKTLHTWFSGTPEDDNPNKNRMALSSTGDYVSSLAANEPMVRNDVDNGPHVDELWVNSHIQGTNDRNRLSTWKTNHAYGSYGNLGWGLGTNYDTHYSACNSDRPQADAQMHTTVHHWGSGGGMGGLIGTDNTCFNGCQWTKKSFKNYDYAIFVASTEVPLPHSESAVEPMPWAPMHAEACHGSACCGYDCCNGVQGEDVSSYGTDIFDHPCNAWGGACDLQGTTGKICSCEYAWGGAQPCKRSDGPRSKCCPVVGCDGTPEKCNGRDFYTYTG